MSARPLTRPALLLAPVAALVAAGWLTIRSVVVSHGWLRALPAKQLAWVAIGLAVSAGLYVAGERRILRAAWSLYGASVALLAACLLLHPIRGSSRWLALGGLAVQPSELAKVALIVVLAKILSRPAATPRDRAVMLGLYAAAVAGVVAPILLQPDLGTACIVLAVATLMLAANAPRAWMSAAFVAGALGALAVLAANLHAYQRARLQAFWSGADELGAGYQVARSVDLVGSGGFAGRGGGSFAHALPHPLPDAYSDFVFAAWAHERGFVGAFALLAAYAVLVGMVVAAAQRARRGGDVWASAVATGAAALLSLHVVLNVGTAVGLLPAVGVPLPLVSYGGSNVVATLALLGLVASGASRRARRAAGAMARLT